MTSPDPLPSALRLRFWLIAAGYGSGILLIWSWLFNQWPAAARWGWLPLAVGGYQLLLLRRNLPLNHRRGETQLLPTLGLGNGFTLTRGLFLALLSGFLSVPEPFGRLAWIPVLLYTLSDLLDFGDGLAARLTNHVTPLGEVLDIEFDGLGVGIITLLAIHYDQVGWWYLSLALARYLFVLGIWWRKRQDKPVYDLTESKYRRLVAGFQMGFMSVIIWPVLSEPGARLGAIVFGIPTLTIFLRDWLVVSGQLNRHNPTYLRWKSRLTTLLIDWLPPLARLTIGITLLTTGLIPLPSGGQPVWRALFSSWGWSEPWVTQAAVALGWLALLVLGCVVLGVFARWAAIVGILPTAVHFVATGSDYANLSATLLLLGTLIITLTHSGRFSLWFPKEYIYAPLGEKE